MALPSRISDPKQLRRFVDAAVQRTPVFDIHTHLYTPNFGTLCLWGIDNLLTYHYLVAELFRSAPVTPQHFWALPQWQQADLIWDALFVRNTPLSEATRGVVTVLTKLGLDPAMPDLMEARRYFASQNIDEYIERIMDLANVSEAVMTNDPFNPVETAVWERSVPRHPRFHAALRLDPLINDWATSYRLLEAQGFQVTADLSPHTITQARCFLDSWLARMRPLYIAVSLPYDFDYGDDSIRNDILREVVLPTSLQHDVPFAMMIGVARRVNPALRDAGDSVGRADIRTLERICLENPDVRFLVSMLSRENQHELCVAARNFSNLMPFGCWWFLSNPSIVTEITTERLEMLSTSFIPQHSDARIIDQLIYKWSHARCVIADVLYKSYLGLIRVGFQLMAERVDRDIERMFSRNFRAWVGLPEETQLLKPPD